MSPVLKAFRLISLLSMVAANLVSVGCSEKILSSIKKEDNSELIYLFESRIEEGKPTLQIDLLFRGDASGESLVRLPSEWQGQAKLERASRGLIVLTAGAQIHGTDQAALKRITHKPSEVVHLRYWLTQDFDTIMPSDENYLRPIVQETYFHWFGGAGLVFPNWDLEHKLDISLRWLSVPAGAHIVNSFGVDESLQSFEASLSELQNSLFLGGDIRLQEFTEGGSHLKVVIRGQTNFEDAVLGSLVHSTWKADLRVFGEERVPFRLFSLISIGKQCCTYRSILARHAVASFVASDQGINLDMKRLVSGELLRSRLDEDLGAAARSSQWLWLRTGVSQTAARLLGLQSGTWTFAEYLEDFNIVLNEYASSRNRGDTYRELTARAASDRGAGRELYIRGDLLGHGEYALARRKGLNWTVIEKEIPSFLKSASSQPGDGAVPAAWGQEARDLYDLDMVRGKTIVPAGDWLGSCARLQWSSLKAFELGFDLEASKQEGRVNGVVRDSAAYRAGLRRNQKLISWRIRVGDPLFEAEIQIRDGKSEKTVRYLPAALKAKKVPQFVLEPSGATGLEHKPDPCLISFGIQ